MKTIRTNTFETNSSSTHSVTIGKKNKKVGGKELVEDGVLHPSRLSGYTNSVGESTFTVADTKDKKAAILIHWVESFFENGQYDTTGDETSWSKFEKETRTTVLEIVKELCGYTDIKITKSFSPDFTSSTENDGDPTEEFLRSDPPAFNEKMFRRFIEDNILDDEVEIVDSNCPY
jgi:hypothetical protein